MRQTQLISTRYLRFHDVSLGDDSHARPVEMRQDHSRDEVHDRFRRVQHAREQLVLALVVEMVVETAAGRDDWYAPVRRVPSRRRLRSERKRQTRLPGNGGQARPVDGTEKDGHVLLRVEVNGQQRSDDVRRVCVTIMHIERFAINQQLTFIDFPNCQIDRWLDSLHGERQLRVRGQENGDLHGEVVRADRGLVEPEHGEDDCDGREAHYCSRCDVTAWAFNDESVQS